MTTVDRLKSIIGSALHLGERAQALTASSPLLGAVPEFDSMAVVTVLTMIEDEFGLTIGDDDISGEIFETLGALAAVVDERTG